MTQQMEQMFKDQQLQDGTEKQKINNVRSGAVIAEKQHDSKEETKEVQPQNYKVKRTKIGIEISNLNETMQAPGDKLNMTEVGQLSKVQGATTSHKK